MFGVNAFGWPYFGQGYPQAPTNIDVPFIGSATQVYALAVSADLALPFISSATIVYSAAIQGDRVEPPFIASTTRVYGLFSVFVDRTGTGAGNGGENFPILLAPNGTTETATLTAGISATATLMHLTGDGGYPSSGAYVVTIDDEVLYVAPLGGGSYRIRGRGLSNTTAASHTASASVSWGDTYDMAIIAQNTIANSFTADITGSGSYTYPGWLICFDSTQAYVGSSRYPMHVTSVLGVFAAAAGSGGSNRCDAAQPNSIASTAAISDNCPAALSNPSRIQTDILPGDVALVRYTNPEASIMSLVSRAAAMQSWFGMKRVDSSDADVTFTDPTGTVIDGSVNGEWLDPLGPGIVPETGLPTTVDVPYTSVTLPGSDRTFTHGGTPSPPNYLEKGWPICALAVRQNNRRVPHWKSWDWHNYNFVYSGFFPDATFCQIVINRNGIVFGSVPEVALPGPQDIDGPDAVWDDGSYEFGASWYVAIFAVPYLVVGPAIGGAGVGGGTGGGGFAPSVSFPSGPSSPSVSVPFVEGGEGGDISPPFGGQHFHATLV